jgi:galactokinase
MSHSLTKLYGPDATAQRERYRQAADRFLTAYGPGEILYFRAPGRVNLIGEHTDYNHGFVMPVALDKDVLLLARRRTDGVVRLTNIEDQFGPVRFSINPSIPPGPAGDWGNYAKGPAQAMAQRLGRPLLGLDGLVVGQPPAGVPRGVGLSSSSAVTVVCAVAFAYINDWSPDRVTMAQFCAEAEWYVGTRGGMMDHFIALLGQERHALFLDCRPDQHGAYTTEQIPLPQGYAILIADSGVRHCNVGGGYNQRVAACRAGVKLLQKTYPNTTHLRDVQQIPWTELETMLPQQVTIGELAAQGVDLGDLPGLAGDTVLKVRSRCRHVWTENERVKAAASALQRGDIKAFGALLDAAHASARDDYEISCPELEILVKTAREVDGVLGARLTGAGWGGCIVALVEDEAAPAFSAYVSQKYLARSGHETSIFSCRSAPGAGVALPH